MKNISFPTKFENIEIEKNKRQFIIEPFYPGYGITIGNALRRILLSSLPGAAITAVKIMGVDHEFSTIPNVKEDVVDILLNIKNIRVKVAGELEEPLKLTMKVNGEKDALAGDFDKQAGVEITNPDFKIATVTDAAGAFELEAWVEKGRGYLPIEMRLKSDKEIGVIEVDALFSPVKQVGFKTENVRVGEMTNYDRVIIDVETDGTVECQSALEEAIKILTEQYNHLYDQVTGKLATAEEASLEDTAPAAVLTESAEPIVENISENETFSDNHVTTEAASDDKPKRKRGRPKKIVTTS